MSADDRTTGYAHDGGADSVDTNSAAKYLATLRQKLGLPLVPKLKWGRK